MGLAIFLIVGTLAGLLALTSFHSTPMSGAAPPPAATTPSASTPAPSDPAASAPAPSDPSVSTAHRTVTGPVVQTMFGPVQVKVEFDGHRIVDVQALQLPSDFALSQQISATAGPELRQEALAAQSARINGVSGATYTSQGYQQSLQAALDKAGS